MDYSKAFWPISVRTHNSSHLPRSDPLYSLEFRQSFCTVNQLHRPCMYIQQKKISKRSPLNISTPNYVNPLRSRRHSGCTTLTFAEAEGSGDDSLVLHRVEGAGGVDKQPGWGQHLQTTAEDAQLQSGGRGGGGGGGGALVRHAHSQWLCCLYIYVHVHV